MDPLDRTNSATGGAMLPVAFLLSALASAPRATTAQIEGGEVPTRAENLPSPRTSRGYPHSVKMVTVRNRGVSSGGVATAKSLGGLGNACKDMCSESHRRGLDASAFGQPGCVCSGTQRQRALNLVSNSGLSAKAAELVRLRELSYTLAKDVGLAAAGECGSLGR